jgi:hypothetical protein
MSEGGQDDPTLGEKSFLLASKQDKEKNYSGGTSKENSLTTGRPRPKLETKVDDKDEAEEDEQSNKLLIAFVMMLITQLGNRIFGRLMTYPMHNYPTFTNILSVFIYVPMCFVYIIPMIWYYGDTVISEEQKKIPKYKFAVMGAYDSVAGIMQVFAINFIASSSIIVLVQQSAIPISMLISFYMLNAKYSFSQYLGAAVVLLGIVVVLLPTMLPSLSSAAVGGGDLQGGDDGTGSASSSGDKGGGDLLWIGILVISCVPMCLSSVYKELALGEMEIDVVYLNGWVAVFQFLMAIPLVIPSSLVVGMPLSAIVPNFMSGADCYMGINTVTAQNQHEYGDFPVDDCSNAALYTNLYIFFNVVYNVLIVVVLKYGSSNILWMASTVIVPLSNVAFSLDIMPNHQPLTIFDIWGLVVIMSGLVIYRFSAGLISFWRRITGSLDELEDLDERKKRMMDRRAARKQYRYLGFNQLEALNAVFDTRVAAETQRALFRSPASIRGNLLMKLGIPPSPHIQLANHGKTGSFIEIKQGSRANSHVGGKRSRSGSISNSAHGPNKV